MDTAQHTTPRCRVLLHPTATYNPDAIRAVQEATGGLIVINGGRAKLSCQPQEDLAEELRRLAFRFATGHVDALPSHHADRRFRIADRNTTPTTADFGPFDGGSAA